MLVNVSWKKKIKTTNKYFIHSENRKKRNLAKDNIYLLRIKCYSFAYFLGEFFVEVTESFDREVVISVTASACLFFFFFTDFFLNEAKESEFAEKLI